MKRIILLYLIFFAVRTSYGQVTPYTGGNGSGYSFNQSPFINCTMFFGGNADGAASNLSALTICPPYFGGEGDGYDMDSSNTCSVILPIKLLEFYGEREPNQNVLHWKTTDGYNIRQFSIERSADGVRFAGIGIVAGSTAYDHPYLFIDNNPNPDINFYRLRITEWDNTVSYSKVLVIKNHLTSLLSLYPNPANISATLYYHSSKTVITSLILYQYDGRVVMRKFLNLKQGANYINIDLQSIEDGLYFMRIGDNESHIKLIVQKK